ncbi:sensor histidine kinase [Paenibacillus melissococcoides]|uniref:histidine kinase n=1 Tax=Paenibacillus melissococcoides TaxID=2912268 RepID=A0ABM9GBX9_9BACL|nr:MULTISPECIES: sensor histidine kinase [Paenibacillus]MEB9897766.1 sensor histidine kinase [Bacillus cereus]CAH8249657.1 sensor histidine kinase [Paenibacillus melissococcoides]CAH8721477.1 sensor histidine kinase [Paenibacillus melissococcoides]CAH8721742.1 sensor histidine kinase [Paenibacillus melissococcoides]GIO82950.1 sensor histidine kinase [Paenibacillus dendritiformis]
MIFKIYPREQIKNYLLIDVIAIVYLFYMVLSSSSNPGLLGSLLLLLSFLVSFYIGLWHRNGYLLAAVLAGLATTALIGIYIDPNLLIFGFIFADLIGRSRSKWHIGIGVAAIGLMFILVYWKRTDDNFLFLPIIIVQMVFPIVIYIMEKAKRLQSKLDAANQQLEKYIQQEERQRIARDLHDTLGQTLMMIKLKCELASKWVDKNPLQAKEELKDILYTSRIALKQVRELVSDLKFISLAHEIEHSRKLLHTAGIELEIVEDGMPPLLASVEETMIALAVREAATNIIKHSQAKQCTIRLETVDNLYCVSITDDGVGLLPSATGNGIQSMKERMQALHGTFTVDSSPGGGTAISMQLPLRQHGKESPAT